MDSNQFSKELNQASPQHDIMFTSDADGCHKLPRQIMPSATALAKQRDITDDTGPKNECTSQNDTSFQFLQNQYAPQDLSKTQSNFEMQVKSQNRDMAASKIKESPSLRTIEVEHEASMPR